MSGAARRQVCDNAAVIGHGLLDRLLGNAIARANYVSEATFYAAVKDRSVTPLRYAMLEMVGANPGLQQVQLGEALAVSAPTVTLLINYWQARGCVERRLAPEDRRSFGIFLTAIGSARLADLRRRANAHDNALCASLTPGERTELKRLLEKLERG